MIYLDFVVLIILLNLHFVYSRSKFRYNFPNLFLLYICKIPYFCTYILCCSTECFLMADVRIVGLNPLDLHSVEKEGKYRINKTDGSKANN